jgi:hypothetical protein
MSRRQAKYILSKLDSLGNKLENYQKKDGFYILTENMAKKMKKIRTDSIEANIYLLDKMILKIPKSATYHDTVIRSYYIGTILNNLSYIVPNFAQTLGIFSHQKQIIVAQEYIQGNTLETLLTKDKLSCKEFLNIFLQILFALEVAQRQYRFCHYDLHLRNIIMKPISKPYAYTIVLDTKRYDFIAEKYIPVIIDFGLASIRFENVTIGTHDFCKFGIFPYLIQGSDMYKFLFHSYTKARGELYRCISSLFLFYGSYDPYKLLVVSIDKLSDISKNYLKKISFSYAATYTPLEFALWIINSQQYSLNIKVSQRDIYFPITKQIYLPISSIMTKYSQKLDEIVDEQMVSSDLKTFFEYKSIEIPDEMSMKDEIALILNTQLGNRKNFTFQFIEQLKPYLQFLYTIRELHLENTYKDFVDEFTNSEHYKLYEGIIFHAEKAKRWSETLEESLK